MASSHVRWSEAGRTLALDSGQRVYTSRVGQANTLDGGVWKPYVIDRVNGVVRFADSELRFTPAGVEHWRKGRQLSRFRADLEAFRAADWQRPVLAVGALELIEEDDGGATAHVRCRYTLSAPEGDAVIELLVGGSHKVHLATTLDAKTAGRYRLTWDVDTLTRPVAQSPQRLPGGRPALAQPFRFDTPGSDLLVRWRMQEAPDHGALLADDRLRVYIGEKDYAVREVKRVVPLTLGPTGIGNDADDGDQFCTGATSPTINPVGSTWTSAGNYANGNLYVEVTNGVSPIVRWAGFGWRAIDLNTASPGVASIDAGTQIVFTNGGDNGTPTVISGSLHGVDAGGGTVWAESGNRPSAQVSTTATTAYTGATTNQTLSVQTIVQEWVVTEATSYEAAAGDDMYFYFEDNAEGSQTASWWSVSDDYDGAGSNVEATLTIQYTASGAAATWGTLLGLHNNRLVVTA